MSPPQPPGCRAAHLGPLGLPPRHQPSFGVPVHPWGCSKHPVSPAAGTCSSELASRDGTRTAQGSSRGSLKGEGRKEQAYSGPEKQTRNL